MADKNSEKLKENKNSEKLQGWLTKTTKSFKDSGQKQQESLEMVDENSEKRLANKK